MPLAVPRYLSVVGLLAFLVIIGRGDIVHLPYSQSSAINTVLDAVGACSFAASAFFGLYGFFVSHGVKREFLLWCFIGGMGLTSMFLTDYLIFKIANRSSNSFESKAEEISLPLLVDGTRNKPLEQQRAICARIAYFRYGVRLPFRREDNTWNYYEPTAEDKKIYASTISVFDSMAKVRWLSLHVLAGSVNVVVYTFVTFTFGLLWLAVKRPSSFHAPAP